MNNPLAGAVAASLAGALCLAALPACAQDTEPVWSFGGEAAVTSDYVWRGVSQTMEDPALQLELSLEHASGFYAGAFASNVDFGDPDDGIDYELEAYVGWAGALGDATELDIYLSRVAYPGHNGADYDIDYTEAQARLTFQETWYVGAAYSPDIFNLGSKSWYWYAGTALPLGDTGFTFTAQAGHFDLDDAAGDSYSDWLIGVDRDFGPVNARLQYTDTSGYSDVVAEAVGDARLADGKLALIVVWSF